MKTIREMAKIRSFVRRQGRLSQSQQAALTDYWPLYGVALGAQPLDVRELFPETKPIILEIGFGMGDSFVQLAAADPTHNYLGIEVHRPGVANVLRAIHTQHLPHVRIICEDAVTVLQHCITKNSLARVLIYFPDPWHKKRHHKRRLIQPHFLDELHRTLQLGGALRLSTDWPDYAQHMLAVAEAHPGFYNSAGSGNRQPSPYARPVTKYQKRAERLGHTIFDFEFISQALPKTR